MKDWLTRHNIAYDDTMLRVELDSLIKLHKDRSLQYRIDKLTADHGLAIVRLPPYHCEFNAIELIWGQVKGDVARHNTPKTESISDLMTTV